MVLFTTAYKKKYGDYARRNLSFNRLSHIALFTSRDVCLHLMYILSFGAMGFVFIRYLCACLSINTLHF